MPKTNQPVSEGAGITKPIVLNLDAESYVRMMCEQFEKTQDPLHLLEAFIHSVHVKRNPPAMILEALAKAFQTVVDSDGKKSLDQVLGLRGTGQGAWTAFTRQKTSGTGFWLSHVLFALTKMRDEDGKKISQEKAADRVSFFLESRPRLKFHEAANLLQDYSRTWKKRFGFDQVSPADSLHPASWTPAQREKFLRIYRSR